MNKKEKNNIRRIIRNKYYYEFDNGTVAICKFDRGYCKEYELRVLNGHWNTVLCHWNIEKILELL